MEWILVDFGFKNVKSYWIKKHETEIVILKLTKKDCERIWPLKNFKNFLLTFGGYFFSI